jgi:tRNA U34 5-carboxymethylaminomethyl modifying GTPase MnmE/TrmE
VIYNNLVFTTAMKSKILALISALITGGVGIAMVSGSQAAQGMLTTN